MSETTQEERDNVRRLWAAAPDKKPNGVVLRALNDADRLAAIERQIQKLAESAEWRCSIDPVVVSVHKSYHKELRAILDAKPPA